jgi:hypothetical protein
VIAIPDLTGRAPECFGVSVQVAASGPRPDIAGRSAFGAGVELPRNRGAPEGALLPFTCWKGARWQPSARRGLAASGLRLEPGEIPRCRSAPSG